MRQLKWYLKIILAIAIIAIVGAILVALWALWSWLIDLSPVLLVVWALLATLVIPVVALAGWAFGRYEAMALLKGIDAGVDRVVGAAIKFKTPVPSVPTNIAILPAALPPVQYRELPPGDVVNL